ncbi:MAG: ABC transporter [Pelagibacteraceae bacterium]|nr:ABC transporter [Pelagibacteraceae bacterium]|tara:strand:- start:2035 stop:3540 length:1506 start_codon:yes stop_codon:yes gene_type:complete
MNPYLIRIENISKNYSGVLANNNVSFNIRKGKIHALLGENGAGKSTIVKILYGLIAPDKGDIFLNNTKIVFKTPSEAKLQGIGMVFQHFSLFESLTVSENLILGIEEKISFDQLKNKVKVISEKYDLSLNLDSPINNLSAGEKQSVEIVRALLQEPEILIMDEPTSVLTPIEAEVLFSTLKKLIKEGKTILYITHKLEEVIKNCEEVTIMRNGNVITTCAASGETKESLALKMLGYKVNSQITDYSSISEELLISAKNLNKKFNDPFLTDLNNISFDVYKGEIFGIAGVAGNGQRELMELLTGENIGKVDGKLTFKNKEITNFTTKQRRDLGIGFVPEDRLGHSAIPELSLSENILLSNFPNNNFSKFGILNFKEIELQAKNVIKEFNVKAPNQETFAMNLSGGNLQKFVIGREIKSNPQILIVFQPTWGVDAGAESFIKESLIKLSKEGTSLIIISQDLDELIEITHKISVISKGSLSKHFKTRSLDIKKLGIMMGGVID